MKNFRNLIVVMSLGLTQVACGLSGPHQASLKDASATPPSFMVAKKIPTTLYVVLDPAKIQDVYNMKGGRTGWELVLSDFHSFVTTDLQGILVQQFERVEIVSPGHAFAGDRYIVADVKVDSVKLHERRVDAYTGQLATRLEMTWGAAFRTSDADDYMFSFAGVGSSDENASSLDDHIAQMIENSLAGFLQKWGEANVRSSLMAWVEGEPADASAATDEDSSEDPAAAE